MIKKIVSYLLVVFSLLISNVVIANDDIEVIELESISNPNTNKSANVKKAEYQIANPSGSDMAKNRRNAERLLMESFYTLQDFESQKNYSEIKKDLGKARAVLIFPSVINAGLLVGVSGGTGVMLARAKNGKWSYPAFYTYNQASLGLQIGADSSKVTMLVMNGKGLGALISDKFQVGASVKGAAGEQGEAIGYSATSNLGNDIKMFAISKGAFIGATLESSSIRPDDNLNRAYYGRDDASTQTVIIDGLYANKHADSFREYLDKFKYQYD
ncbi:MAG: lipid-binding SYLF domain-containing protein [Alphaproteobacteria bacterium]|nr:lipid-binding SYLF domain-containing protein [Alphaproteobacteria bacterium]